MLTIAFCQDSPLARKERQRQFAPHIQHLHSIMPSIRLAAPLATADGAAISDDDRLVASVFALETTTYLSAKELMSADPYCAQRTWSCVSLFTPTEQYGEWLAPSVSGKSPQGGVYASFSTDHGKTPSGRIQNALFGARLQLADSIGDPTLSRPWQSMTLLTAASLAEASSMMNSATRTEATQVWAIPLAVGAWPGKSNL
jgi:uncharacterized protein YciI